MQHLQPNTTLQGGKYRIERVLGQGGFGITYLARNTVFDIDVAIKEFFMKDENDRDGSSVTMPNTTKQELFHGQMEKFKKEAKRMFAIKNEHIVGVQDLFEENGTAYYVMDYVDGENLAERLKRTGKPMSEQEVRDILPQILDALKSIHDAGIWHLDLKPANIMLTKEGKVKLIDFGASKQLNAQKGGATTSTAISYTNGYAPREQMEQNYDKFGPWTDIYALGATLYNLLTYNRPPLPTDIDDDISEDKHVALPMPSNISENMRGLELWLMQTNRLKRPQSIAELKNILISLWENSSISEKSVFGDKDIVNTYPEETILVPQKEEKPKEGAEGVSVLNAKAKLKPSVFNHRSKFNVILLCTGVLVLGFILFFMLVDSRSEYIGYDYSIGNIDKIGIVNKEYILSQMKDYDERDSIGYKNKVLKQIDSLTHIIAEENNLPLVIDKNGDFVLQFSGDKVLDITDQILLRWN